MPVKMGRRLYVSAPELAEMLGVSRVTVWRWIRAGHVRARFIGNLFLVDLNDAKAYVRAISRAT